MNVRRLRCVAGGLVVAMLAASCLAATAAQAQEKKKKDLDLDKIPKAVMDALKKKFPAPEIRQWTKEKEGGDVIYDIEFKQKGRNCEADIKEDGTILNFEKEVAADALPEAVTKTVKTKYPQAKLKEIMEITEVKESKEKLEGYEIVLQTADNREVEITVAPDGKILEDSGTQKEEKKEKK